MHNIFTNDIVDEFTSWFDDAVVQIGNVRKMGVTLSFMIIAGSSSSATILEPFNVKPHLEIASDDYQLYTEKAYNVLDNDIICLTEADYKITHSKIMASLKLHRGEMMSATEMSRFNLMAIQLAALNIEESFVRFIEADRHVSLSLLFAEDIVLNISQYCSQEEDVVFSIEKNDKLLFASHSQIATICRCMPAVVEKLSNDGYELSPRDFA